MQEEFKVKGEYIKLGQLLKVMNYIENGSDAKFIIQEGNVKVNGTVVLERGKKIHPGDIVEYKDKSVHVY